MIASNPDPTSGRLDAARLAGSALLAIFAQFAVDTPSGYFGPADRVTTVGIGFVAGVTLVCLTAVALRLTGQPGARLLSGLQYVLVVSAFVPPTATDPVIAGPVVFWHLLLFGQLASGVPPRRRLATRIRLGSVETPFRRHGAAARHLLGISVMIAVTALGFRVGDRVPAQIICAVAGAAGLSAAAPFLLDRLRRRSIAAVLIVILLLVALATFRFPEVALTVFVLTQACSLVLLWMDTQVFDDLVGLFYRRPAYLVVVSFLVLIALGTLFLSFPAAAAGGEAVHPVDALFTATSAACVTGLIVLDTPVDFSGFGHLVILVLMQAGGLNIMVLSAFAAGVLGRSLGFRGEGAVRDMLDLQPGRSVRRLVLFVGLGTLAAEAVGAGALSALYVGHGFEFSTAVWYGVFHSVSAFCNAGFSLHSDSLAGFAGDPAFLFVMAALIAAGGLGFGVLGYAWSRVSGRRRDADSLHARIVLLASGVLVAVGALVYGVMEWNHTLADLDVADRIVNALFQSVTLRTAGFNSVGFEELQPATLWMMLVWMFVGASPGGTGGGIKTTTAVVLFGAVLAVLARRDRVVLSRRRMSLDTIFRSAAIVTIASATVIAGTFALLATQTGAFQVVLFEAMSAFGTVGLSLGATAELEAAGKVIVMALMLAGRVGPLTLALLVGREGASRVRYPESRLMVG